MENSPLRLNFSFGESYCDKNLPTQKSATAVHVFFYLDKVLLEIKQTLFVTILILNIYIVDKKKI